jgi:hypothetical protein
MKKTVKKNNCGRKKMPPEKKNVKICICILYSDLQKMYSIAEKQDTTVNQLYKKITREFLEKNFSLFEKKDDTPIDK